MRGDVGDELSNPPTRGKWPPEEVAEADARVHSAREYAGDGLSLGPVRRLSAGALASCADLPRDHEWQA